MDKIISKLLNCKLSETTFSTKIQANWFAEGVLQLIPSKEIKQAVIISSGIHGNETAPVELLAELLASLSENMQPLNCALLIIFGNLPAMRVGKRYMHSDMNRLFSGLHRHEVLGNESRRASLLEQAVRVFFETVSTSSDMPFYHFDMHTTIRGSCFPQFALIPYHRHAYSEAFFELLASCELDAIVQHISPSGTFSHYVSEQFGAQSCTLELGKIQPFGQNNLCLFKATARVIRALISGFTLPLRTKPPVKFFTVAESIVKMDSSFRLNLAPSVKNFTQLTSGAVIASENNKVWNVKDTAPWILFPNADVSLGLRAGLLLQSDVPCFSPQS